MQDKTHEQLKIRVILLFNYSSILIMNDNQFIIVLLRFASGLFIFIFKCMKS